MTFDISKLFMTVIFPKGDSYLGVHIEIKLLMSFNFT